MTQGEKVGRGGDRKCARCGDDEFRIDGHCSPECRDMGEVERERDAALSQSKEDARLLRAAVAEMEKAWAERDEALGLLSALRARYGSAQSLHLGMSGMLDRIDTLLRKSP